MRLASSDFEKFEKHIILKNVGINGQKKIFNSKLHVIDLEKAFYKIYNLKKDNRSCCDLILD